MGASICIRLGLRRPDSFILHEYFRLSGRRPDSFILYEVQRTQQTILSPLFAPVQQTGAMQSRKISWYLAEDAKDFEQTHILSITRNLTASHRM